MWQTIISSSFTGLLIFFGTLVFVTIAYYITPNLNYEINEVLILILILAISGAFGAFVINLFSEISLDTLKSERLRKLPRESSNNSGDWTIEKTSCRKNEKIKITITNLNEKPIEFKENDKFCDIELKKTFSDTESNDDSYNLSIKVKEPITILRYGTYSLLWDTSKPDEKKREVVEGIYRITPHNFEYPLRRAIVVSGSAKQEGPKVTEGTWDSTVTVTKGEGDSTVVKGNWKLTKDEEKAPTSNDDEKEAQNPEGE
ncbi:TPA: hypothetical protein HA351_05800 [Methanosarcinaceae archaeon]|nr:hypothetical protein [Methanosarcinaceae archaeon]